MSTTTDNIKKNWKVWAIVGGIILIVLIAGAIYFYRKGKKTVTIQQLPGQLPGDTSGASGNYNGASNDEIKMIAQAIYQDMSGFNWAGHDITPYQAALELNDTDLTKLYNAFNDLYQTESGQTLSGWIASEDFLNNAAVTDALKTKMAKLNLI